MMKNINVSRGIINYMRLRFDKIHVKTDNLDQTFDADNKAIWDTATDPNVCGCWVMQAENTNERIVYSLYTDPIYSMIYRHKVLMMSEAEPHPFFELEFSGKDSDHISLHGVQMKRLPDAQEKQEEIAKHLQEMIAFIQAQEFRSKLTVSDVDFLKEFTQTIFNRESFIRYNIPENPTSYFPKNLPELQGIIKKLGMDGDSYTPENYISLERDCHDNVEAMQARFCYNLYGLLSQIPENASVRDFTELRKIAQKWSHQ